MKLGKKPHVARESRKLTTLDQWRS